jgi:hypothetical protein
VLGGILALSLMAGAFDVYDDEFDTRPILTLEDVTYELRPSRVNNYPEAAASRGVEGEATIVCHIWGSGHIGECATERETPPNAQFGNATARRFIALLTIGPKTTSGEPTAGRRIRIHQTWRLHPGAAPGIN